MGIDALLLHLEQDAGREVARLRSAAEEGAAAIAARAEADAARRRALHLERVTAELGAAGERQVAGARARVREQLLQVRTALLDRVFDRASALLGGMAASGYAPIIGHLARDAARYLEEEPTVLQCPADAAAALADAVPDLPNLTVQSAGIPAGVTGRSADGRVVVDNSLPALLSRRRAELAIGLVARIEGS
jgi:vacuolar-type H+-ATPase subunit E/Vma4